MRWTAATRSPARTGAATWPPAPTSKRKPKGTRLTSFSSPSGRAIFIACLLGLSFVAAHAGAAAPTVEEGRYLFTLSGLPVGEVTLRWDHARGTFEYTQLHRFVRGSPEDSRQNVDHFELDGRGFIRSGMGAGRMPASLVLWTLPRKGCVDAVDELTHRLGQVCRAQALTPPQRPDEHHTTGTLFGNAYQARYVKGRMVRLELPPARFELMDATAEAPRPAAAPAQEGFSIATPQRGATLGLTPVLMEEQLPAPPRPATASLVRLARAEGEKDRADPAKLANCVTHALALRTQLVARKKIARLVFGVVEDDGRGYPHAWVRVGEGAQATDVDSTLNQPVTPEHYLALGLSDGAQAPKAVGQIYLALVKATRRLEHRD